MIWDCDHFVQVLFNVYDRQRPAEIDVFNDVSDDVFDDVSTNCRDDFDDEDLTKGQVFLLNFGWKFVRRISKILVLKRFQFIHFIWLINSFIVVCKKLNKACFLHIDISICLDRIYRFLYHCQEALNARRIFY